MSSWLLVAVLSSGGMWSERFPNKESCDAIRLWVTTHTELRGAVCLEDLANEPSVREDLLPSSGAVEGAGQ